MKNIEKTKAIIRQYWDNNKRMPSFSEIAKLLGYKSKNSIFKLVSKLEEENFLSQDLELFFFMKKECLKMEHM